MKIQHLNKRTIIEQDKCPICDGTELESYHKIDSETETRPDSEWMLCQICGIRFQFEFRRHRGTRVYEKHNGVLTRDSLKLDSDKLTKDYKKKNFIEKVETASMFHPEGGKIVTEIGFGGGEILCQLREQDNWDRVMGVEISNTMVINAIENLNFPQDDIFYHDITNPDILPCEEKSDLIIINETMEHVEKPIPFIKGSSDLLADDGVMFASFDGSTGPIVYKRSELYYWSMAAIQMIAEKCNLQIKHVITKNTYQINKDVEEVIQEKYLVFFSK
jgi:2-polyprenyl-3-methyl-5-hydroxy-6-metoxy-1,4-benzoquinol methylase